MSKDRQMLSSLKAKALLRHLHTLRVAWHTKNLAFNWGNHCSGLPDTSDWKIPTSRLTSLYCRMVGHRWAQPVHNSIRLGTLSQPQAIGQKSCERQDWSSVLCLGCSQALRGVLSCGVSPEKVSLCGGNLQLVLPTRPLGGLYDVLKLDADELHQLNVLL